MVGLQDIKRFLAPIQRKIFLLIGRAIVAAINDSETTQKLQLKLLADEIVTDLERFEEYGFSTYPWENAEALAGFINGNRDHGIVIVVHDRRYRPDYLTQGEVVLYTEEDHTTPFRVHLKRSRILNIKCADLDVDVSGDEDVDIGGDSDISVGGDKITDCGTDFMVTAGSNILLGSTSIAALRRFVDDRFVTLFNNHVHSGVDSGPSNTGVPTSTMSTGSHCTDKVRGI